MTKDMSGFLLLLFSENWCEKKLFLSKQVKLSSPDQGKKKLRENINVDTIHQNTLYTDQF